MQATYQPTKHNIFNASGEITGYEIHSGHIKQMNGTHPLYQSKFGYDGAINEDPLIFGTFIHDIFKNTSFTRELINFLRRKKNLPELKTPLKDVESLYNNQYDLIADTIKEHCRIQLTPS